MKSMPEIVAEQTVHEAWVTSANHLLAGGDRLNLVVHIVDPTLIDGDILKQLDPRSVDAAVMSVFDVATTIFPQHNDRWKLGVNDFVNHYLPVYARLRRRGGRGWGFYFQRLTSFGDAKVSQLSRIVDGLGSWGHGHHGAFMVHISSADTDRPRPQGGPCWQYGQFMADGGVLSLTAVYRSHDYFLKALGNFVGLARLLSYVALKTGHSVGTLTCVSTYAFLGARRVATARLLGK